jgi:hypothetical protein
LKININKPYKFSILKSVLLFLLFVLRIQANAQGDYKPYFRYPMDSLPHFVSPFGAMRDNHFHSGVDLKTQEKEGLPVYAVADGYISRIKIASNGYGKAIYIDHPNGFTTVYGHLQCYKGAIADWINKYQYKQQKFAFDTVFKQAFIWVKKGDTIGLSGNSGGSTGPHLHFEIRETRTEEIWNPGLFGMLPNDTLKPFLSVVHFYQFVPEGLLLQKRIPIQQKKLYLRDSVYLYHKLLVYEDTIQLPPEQYGLGIVGYDYIHQTRDEKGLYDYGLIHQNRKIFGFKLKRFAFSESKYINQHIDYPWYKLNQQRIQKCFKDDGNTFSMIETNKQKGKFYLKPNHLDSIIVYVGDINDNYTYVMMYVKTGEPELNSEKEKYFQSIQSKPLWKPNVKNKFSFPGFKIESEPGDFYDSIYLDCYKTESVKNTFSPVYKVHQNLTPIHKSLSIEIDVTDFSFSDSKYLCLASVNKAGKLSYAGGKFYNNRVKGEIGNFGNYTVAADSISPTANLLNARDTTSIRIRIDDQFSGIANYDLYLNNNWVLGDYDAKNDLLIYTFDEVYYREKSNGLLNNTQANWSIKLVDKKGNKFEKTWQLDW